MRVLWLIGIDAADVGQEWIPIAIAAAAGGHCLTLRQGVETAALHMGRDVLAAILTRRRRRRHRDTRHGEKPRARSCGYFQKLFHRVLSCVGFSPGRHGMSAAAAPSASEKSKTILSGTQ